jgi:hypothetical protein
LLARGSKYKKEDLIGTWTYINADKFRDTGQIVPQDLEITFSQHPKKKGLLVTELTAPKRPQFRQQSVAFLDTRMLPHLRVFALPEKGQPEDPSMAYSVYLTTMGKSRQGMPVMLQQNILNLGIYMAVKKQQGKPGAPQQPSQAALPQQPQVQGSAPPSASPPPAAPPPPPPPARQGLDGVWQSADGETIIIQGRQYQVSEAGQLVDAGVFQVNGNVLVTQSSYTGVVTQFLFQLQGNVLLVQDGFGEVYQYHRRSGQ